jgi:ornithine carbamoyltransferase
VRHAVTIADLTTEETSQLLSVPTDLKEEWKRGGGRRLLAGKTLGMMFQLPSLHIVGKRLPIR